jgi:hypothetical protein
MRSEPWICGRPARQYGAMCGGYARSAPPNNHTWSRQDAVPLMRVPQGANIRLQTPLNRALYGAQAHLGNRTSQLLLGHTQGE